METAKLYVASKGNTAMLAECSNFEKERRGEVIDRTGSIKFLQFAPKNVTIDLFQYLANKNQQNEES